MKQAKARILIVEDDPAILKGLSDVLIFNGYDVEQAEDGGAGLTAIQSHRYDLVLLDVMLPTLDGISICKKVREVDATQPIIMITAKGAEDDIIAGFRAGADDYVPKPFSLRELMVRIEAVLRRSGKHLGDEQIEYGEILFDGKNLRASHGDIRIELTRREMDIIVYLHRFQDRIVSKQELLKEVWNYTDPSIETRTVDIHIQKLRKKINGLGCPSEMIKTIRGEGYRLEYGQA